MYKYINGALPACFNPCFTLTSNIHSYNTRSAARKNLYVNYSRTSLFKNSAVQRGTLYWNSLDDSSKLSPTLSSFARKLKKKSFLIAY